MNLSQIFVLSLNAALQVDQDSRRMSESRQSSGRKAKPDLQKYKQPDKKILFTVLPVSKAQLTTKVFDLYLKSV